MAKQVFQCELCGMIHKNKADAEKCEKSHLWVKEVQEYVFEEHDKQKYPSILRCAMSNGEVVNYYRKQTNYR